MAYVQLILCLIVVAAVGYALAKVRLKPAFKAVAVLVGVIALVFGIRAAMSSGMIPTPAAMKAFVPEKTASLAGDVGQAIPASYELPAQPVTRSGCVKLVSIPWNGASPITLANGGPRTEKGSLVEQYAGGCLQVERQDDYGVQKDELVKFAQGVKNGEANPQGAAFAVMMGDAYAAYAESLQERMNALGDEVVVIGVTGFSYGEDKVLGKPLNGNPQNAKGSLMAGVPYDGNWNSLVKWAGDNGIRVNARQDAWDPEALNTVDTTSFTDAGDKYVNNYCEDRKVIVEGKPTGEKKKVCVDGVLTWFPGDRFVVTRKGGLTTWVSTKEYNQQMPTVIITTKAWAEKNRPYIVGLLRAFDRAAFDIRAGGGIDKLGKTQAAVFGTGGGEEAQPDFWTKAFRSYPVTDGQGNTVTLGGTRVITLAEARDFLGAGGGFSTFKAVYETFGNYAKAFYPKDVPGYPAYEKVVDTSYVTAALGNVSAQSQSAFTEKKSVSSVVSERSYSIEFAVGSARLTPQGMRTVNEIANSAAIAGEMRIRLVGHTDNTGDPSANLALSRQRAQAVADALTALDAKAFPPERIEVQGMGSNSPVSGVDENSAEGRAKNRRVEVALGS